MCSFEWKGLRKRKIINLSELEGEDYVIFFKGFGDVNGVNLRVNFIKVCEGLNGCD